MEYYMGVFYTTSDRCRSQMVKFQANYIDCRKEHMLPSFFCGHTKNPQLCRGFKVVRLLVSKRKERQALLSDLTNALSSRTLH
jgi:hypothetical protein